MTSDTAMMFEQYRGLIHWTVTKFRARYRVNADADDLFQSGCLSFCRCLRGYNPALGWKFSTYVSVAIWRRLHYECFGRKQPLLAQFPEDLEPTVAAAADTHIDDRLDAEQLLDTAIAEGVISERDRQIVESRASGLTYREIGDDLNLSRARAKQLADGAHDRMRTRFAEACV